MAKMRYEIRADGYPERHYCNAPNMDRAIVIADGFLRTGAPHQRKAEVYRRLPGVPRQNWPQCWPTPTA
jgi:hypothetical protein